MGAGDLLRRVVAAEAKMGIKAAAPATNLRARNTNPTLRTHFGYSDDVSQALLEHAERAKRTVRQVGNVYIGRPNEVEPRAVSLKPSFNPAPSEILSPSLRPPDATPLRQNRVSRMKSRVSAGSESSDSWDTAPSAVPALKSGYPTSPKVIGALNLKKPEGYKSPHITLKTPKPNLGPLPRRTPSTSTTSASSAPLNPNVSSGANLMAGIAGDLAFGAIGGGIVGGGVSYFSGGEFGQGAMVGAMAGGGLAGGYHGALKLGQAGITGFSPKIAAATANFQDANIRRGAFAGGAMLAGGVFGGNRSHRRGFNSSRGNTINH